MQATIEDPNDGVAPSPNDVLVTNPCRQLITRVEVVVAPIEEDPEVFGLHPNANITSQQNIVRGFMDTILMI